MVKTIRIKLDYLSGPIWKEFFDEETGMESTGVTVVDRDFEINELNQTIQDLYSSYFRFDVSGNQSNFDVEQEILDKGKLLGLLAALNRRLSEINDGSFVVLDEETPRLQRL